MMSQQLLGVLVLALVAISCRAQTFDQTFVVNWAGWNVIPDDYTKEVKLQLTSTSGASIATSGSYLYGHFSVSLKLIAGESSGTVCSFYLTSYSTNHDEIDFEFLGNETGQPYVLHTNVFVNGVGGREQRIFLWFDPTTDFHTYSVYWNHNQILWSVDDTPIRVHKNRESQYPNSYPYYQPMVVAASIFDGSSWATRGGLVPVKWEYAPLTVTLANFVSDACRVWNNDIGPCNANWESNYWEVSQYAYLNDAQALQLNGVKNSFMVYDYCTDLARYPIQPPECAYNAV